MTKRDKLLEFVRRNPGWSTVDYSYGVGRPRGSVDRDLRVLMWKGLVIRRVKLNPHYLISWRASTPEEQAAFNRSKEPTHEYL